MNDKTKASKTMSFYLRHHPEELGVSLDADGWVSVELFLSQLATKGLVLTFDELSHIVETDSKGRFSIRDGDIRANQGHSTKQVSIEFESKNPTGPLYHGTTLERWTKIQERGGLSPMTRQYVHLTDNLATAKNVAGRWRNEKPILLEIDAAAMSEAGIPFYISENSVWLVKTVPLQYLKQL